MSIVYHPYDKNWCDHLANTAESTIREEYVVDGNTYLLTLRLAHYIANGHKVVAYELKTNQPIDKNLSSAHPFCIIEDDDINKHTDDNGNSNGYVIAGINADNIVMSALFTLIMDNDKIASEDSILKDSMHSLIESDDDTLTASSGLQDPIYYREHLKEIYKHIPIYRYFLIKTLAILWD